MKRNLPKPIGYIPLMSWLWCQYRLYPCCLERDFFQDLNNHSTLGSLYAQTKPHRLISGVLADLAGILPHCAANQHTGWDWRARKSIAMMGLLHSKNSGAQNEGLFLKTIIHFTLTTTVCLAAVTKTNIRNKITHLPIVVRLSMPLEGLAKHFPSDTS